MVTSEPVCIVMFLWGDELYGIDDVNMIVSRIFDLASEPVEIVLVTDKHRPQIDPRVRQIDIPDQFYDPSRVGAGYTEPKLAMFKEGLLPAGRRVLYLDIDTLIVSDPLAVVRKCDDPNAIYMLPVTLVPIGRLGRMLSQLTGWKKRPRGNSSVMVFTSGMHSEIAAHFLELKANGRAENCPQLRGGDDRFISWNGFQHLEPMPKDAAASVRRCLMTWVRPWGWVRRWLPWVIARRNNMALLTLDDRALKLSSLAELETGDWVTDKKGRTLNWSAAWMGNLHQRLNQEGSQIFSVKRDSKQ